MLPSTCFVDLNTVLRVVVFLSSGLIPCEVRAIYSIYIIARIYRRGQHEEEKVAKEALSETGEVEQQQQQIRQRKIKNDTPE